MTKEGTVRVSIRDQRTLVHYPQLAHLNRLIEQRNCPLHNSHIQTGTHTQLLMSLYVTRGYEIECSLSKDKLKLNGVGNVNKDLQRKINQRLNGLYLSY